ncbi:MAG: hypothetical protein ACRYGG_05065 [Janthinobacterium lividum]
MADNVPASIAAPFQTVTAEGEDNERQQNVLRERLANRTVGVYDERDNSVLQAPIADEQKYRDLGLVVGDAEAAKKQVLNSGLGQLDALVHHTANAASFNTYDNVAALLGQKKYLQNEKEVDAENPYSALAGDLTGGAITAEGRAFTKAGLAFSAYEGGTAAATNAYALNEPITAERLIKGAGAAMMYNALFNTGINAAAKGVSKLSYGLHGLNGKLGVFLKEGEEAGELTTKAVYRGTPRGGVKRPMGPYTEEAVQTTVPKEKPTSTAEKMGETLKRDPEQVVREWHENEVAQKKALVELDGLDHESSAADKIRKSLEKMEEKAKALDGELHPQNESPPAPSEHIPAPNPLSEEGRFEYPGAMKLSHKISMWRNSFRALLDTEHANLLDAARQSAGARGDALKKAGDMVEASQAFDEKAAIERQLHKMYPDTFHPETGDLQPGFMTHIKEYARLNGNDTAGLGTLKYRMANAAEKAAIDAEVTAHPDSAAQFKGDTPSQKPINEGEPHVPEISDAQKSFNESKQKLEDLKNERLRGGENLPRSEIDRLNREWDQAQGVHDFNTEALKRANKPKPFASQAPLNPDPGNIPAAPGEVNKVSDITGDTPSEQSAKTVGKGGPKYVPRWSRSTFWKLYWATPKMLMPLVNAAHAFNEIGPFVLNNSERFASGVQSIADASAKGTAGAIRKAISGTLGRNAAMGDTDPKKEFDKNVKMVTAGQASPGSLEQGIKTLLGPEAEQHPELTGHVVAAAGRQLENMSNGMPRNVQAPTARGSNYTPPRSVMVRYNRMVRAIADPDVAIANPDPDTWAAVQAAHPETAKYVQDTLMAVVANPKIKLNKQQARNVSVLLGGAVTPQNQPDYLKSQHDAATLMNAPNPPGKPSGGGTSAKTGQQMLSLDATPDQQAQLGL